MPSRRAASTSSSENARSSGGGSGQARRRRCARKKSRSTPARSATSVARVLGSSASTRSTGRRASRCSAIARRRSSSGHALAVQVLEQLQPRRSLLASSPSGAPRPRSRASRLRPGQPAADPSIASRSVRGSRQRAHRRGTSGAARRSRAARRPCVARDDVDVQVRNALADEVVDRDEGALGAEGRLHRARQQPGVREQRRSSSSGRSGSVSRWVRGTSRSARGTAGGCRGRPACARPRARPAPATRRRTICAEGAARARAAARSAATMRWPTDQRPDDRRRLRKLAGARARSISKRRTPRSASVSAGCSCSRARTRARAVQAVLPAGELGVVGADVLQEQELSPGPQHAPHLGQRSVRVADRAQSECRDGRVERVVLEGQRLGGRLNDLGLHPAGVALAPQAAAPSAPPARSGRARSHRSGVVRSG